MGAKSYTRISKGNKLGDLIIYKGQETATKAWEMYNGTLLPPVSAVGVIELLLSVHPSVCEHSHAFRNPFTHRCRIWIKSGMHLDNIWQIRPSRSKVKVTGLNNMIFGQFFSHLFWVEWHDTKLCPMVWCHDKLTPCSLFLYPGSEESWSSRWWRWLSEFDLLLGSSDVITDVIPLK